MTKAQIKNYNRMLATLRTIASYQSISQLRGHDYGLDYQEVLEMAYENVLEEAKRGARHIRPIKE